jgi:hypothetical protein
MAANNRAHESGHVERCFKRWTARLNRPRDSNYREEWYGQQCLHCRFFVPLSGQLGEDFGVCSNPDSGFDGKVMFEHDGCEFFVVIDET